MFDSAETVDWPLPRGRAWMPTAIVEQLDLTGGGCELVAWDKLGNPILWMGSPGRTQPVISTLLAIGSFAITVTSPATPSAETTLQGALMQSQTSALAELAYAYQWDMFDSVGIPHPFLIGSVTSKGKELP